MKLIPVNPRWNARARDDGQEREKVSKRNEQ